MPYSYIYDSSSPGHLVLLLGLSASMGENGKIDYLVSEVQEYCKFLVARCTLGLRIENRYTVSIIGYNTDVYRMWNGNVEKLSAFLHQIGQDTPLFDKAKKMEEGGCLPCWQTYTAKAFRMVKADIEEWIDGQEEAGIPIPAPMVIHVTDGLPDEWERGRDEARADALKAAQEIKDISLPDGNPLIFNFFIGNYGSQTMIFPSQRPNDRLMSFLYDTSSAMPERIYNQMRNSYGFSFQRNSHLMAAIHTGYMLHFMMGNYFM